MPASKDTRCFWLWFTALVREDGELAEFMDSYDLTWGQFKDITHPAPGNHDYHTEGAQGYFDYFGDAANPSEGYYSFDIGNWHLVAVNSGDGISDT